MDGFLQAIPAAASSPYALVAYGICAVLFLFAGFKLRELRSVLRVIKDVPAPQRAPLIQAVTGKILPARITAEQWIRNNRNQGILLVAGAIIVMGGAVGTVAFINRDPAPGVGPPIAEANEAIAAFLKLMDASQYEEAWERFYPANKEAMPKPRWLELSARYRAPLGSVDGRKDAGGQSMEIRLDRRLNGYVLQYYTKFSNAENPIREVIGLASPGAPVPWRVVSYTVDVPPNSPLL
jgi:hypothetical protein